jgi:chromosome segregation ATPase
MNTTKLQARKEELEKNLKQLEAQLHQVIGAIAILDEQIKESNKDIAEPEEVEDINTEKSE